MCGIAGIIAPGGVDWDTLARMASSLRHRGPDGHGFAAYSAAKGLQVTHGGTVRDIARADGIVGVAHLRLSVIDLSAESAQPFVNDAGTLALTYNGELYNYQDLRIELEQLGHRFRTNGDTEVVLRAYEAWGPDCVRRFNGMWAFAIVDTQRRFVYLARDRFGIKPLYYVATHDAFYFASEIKALLTAPGVKRGPNVAVVAKYLRDGSVDHSTETFYEGIYQLPASHWAIVPLRSQALRIQPVPYWSIPREGFDGSEDEAIDQYRDLLLDSLRRHAHSDVPVGTCLSGGLDSSTIVCAMAGLRAKGLVPQYRHVAFGYCSPDERFSERHYMDAVAAQAEAQLHHVEVSQQDFIDQARRIVAGQDEPFGSASIMAQWFVFQRARAEGITVMLDGQGADEVLGGYHKYFANLAFDLLERRRLADFYSLWSAYRESVGPFPLSGRLAAVALTPRSLRPVLRRVRRRARQPVAGNGLFQPEVLSTSGENGLLERDLGALNDELALDVRSRNLPALLRYEDRNSMAHSIEARVPFLDYRLVELAFRLPPDLKIRGLTTKYVLRRAFGDMLPEVVVNRRDKIGFRAATKLTKAILEHDRAQLAEHRTEYERAWYAPSWIEQALARYDTSADAEFATWRAINLKYWLWQHWAD